MPRRKITSYEVWDVETGNLIGVYKSKRPAEKLAASNSSLRMLPIHNEQAREHLRNRWLPR